MSKAPRPKRLMQPASEQRDSLLPGLQTSGRPNDVGQSALASAGNDLPAGKLKIDGQEAVSSL